MEQHNSPATLYADDSLFDFSVPPENHHYRQPFYLCHLGLQENLVYDPSLTKDDLY